MNECKTSHCSLESKVQIRMVMEIKKFFSEEINKKVLLWYVFVDQILSIKILEKMGIWDIYKIIKRLYLRDIDGNTYKQKL